MILYVFVCEFVFLLVCLVCVSVFESGCLFLGFSFFIFFSVCDSVCLFLIYFRVWVFVFGFYYVCLFVSLLAGLSVFLFVTVCLS